jgi:aminoglycoside phosphotransferase (APT) family kinase protein
MATTTAGSDEHAVRRWLGDRLGVDGSQVTISSLAAAGDSNLMFDVTTPGRRWVLRMPPGVKNDRSAHDVLREYRMLVVLDGTPIPHPAPVAACEDPSIAGRPFYVMEHIDGFSPSQPLEPPWAGDAEACRSLGPRAAEALADLASVPWRELGLDGFGRPDGFLERQVPRWLRQLEGYKQRELDGLDHVARWLLTNRPPDSGPAILHGDYHLRNVMFARRPPAQVVALVDWEMATIGDPLLDLGALLATWSQDGEEVIMNGSVTHQPGMATRAEIATAYERRRGAAVDHLDYYMALALFKLICILEGSYSRLLRGESQHEGHRSYESLVPTMLRRAEAITRGTWGIG